MENKELFYFKDLTQGTKYEILDEAKNKDEIMEVCKKRGIVYPCNDIAVFKGRYAVVDKFNDNKCKLPRKEVEKALGTLIGKAVDIDHKREMVRGNWLDAYLEGNDIISYGSFLKGNFPKEYETFKKRTEEGKVKLSFEAWGNREFNPDKTYSLEDIEFAGGAILSEGVDPACEEAEILEFASQKYNVLEFASLIKEKECQCKTCDGKCKDKEIEKSKKEETKLEEPNVTPEEGKTIENKPDEQKPVEGQVIPAAVEAVKKIVKRIFTEMYISITNFSDQGEVVERKTASRDVTEYSDGTSETIDNENASLTVYTQAQLDEAVNKVKTEKDAEIATIKSEVETSKITLETVTKEINTLKEIVTAKETEVANSKTELENAKKEKDTQIQFYKDNAVKIHDRKVELGTFSEGLTEEQILNDKDYENAKLKKENAELKEKDKPEETIVVGGKDNVDSGAKSRFAVQKRVNEILFGKEKEK